MRGTPTPHYQFSITPAVKWLLIANVSIWFFLQVLVGGYGKVPINHYLALFPGKVIYGGHLWQMFTYMFLHTFSVSHILFNMLMLWFVGTDLERRWGKRFFLFYYFASGVGAAIIYCLGVAVYAAITGGQQGLVIPVLGASGAVFGLLLAYGILFGDRVIHFMMIFPMQAKYFVIILGAIEMVSLITSGVTGGEVAYLAHLGGLLAGYLTLIGSAAWQKLQWNAKAKKRGKNLRLVVNNDKNRRGPPQFWH